MNWWYFGQRSKVSVVSQKLTLMNWYNLTEMSNRLKWSDDFLYPDPGGHRSTSRWHHNVLWKDLCPLVAVTQEGKMLTSFPAAWQVGGGNNWKATILLYNIDMALLFKPLLRLTWHKEKWSVIICHISFKHPTVHAAPTHFQSWCLHSLLFFCLCPVIHMDGAG